MHESPSRGVSSDERNRPNNGPAAGDLNWNRSWQGILGWRLVRNADGPLDIIQQITARCEILK